MSIKINNAEKGANNIGDVFESEEFLPAKELNKNSKSSCDGLLTKEDLIRIDREEPFWSKLRKAFLVLAFLIWIGMLISAILIIVFTEKCPPQEKEAFWNSKVGYWLDPFAFRDNNNDMVGDLEGLSKSVDYLESSIGAGYVILGSILKGQFTNKMSKLGLVEDFGTVDPALGDRTTLKKVIRNFKKKGIEVVLSLPFNSVAKTSKLAKEPYAQKLSASGIKTRDDVEMQEFYGTYSDMFDLNVADNNVTNYIKKTMVSWLDLDVSGILLPDAAFYGVELNDVKPDWFDTSIKNRLYTDTGLKFIQSLRTFIDEYSAKTGKQRLLAVEAGDTGFADSTKERNVERLLGTKIAPGAHLAISKAFVRNQGAKGTEVKANKPVSVLEIVEKHNNIRNMALTLATSSDAPYKDLVSLATTLLLPASPIIYYGTELGINPTASINSPTGVFPKGAVPLVNKSPEDTQLTSHLVFPWDFNGKGFSSNGSSSAFIDYITGFGIDSTVQSVRAVGHKPNTFDLLKDLIKLREKKCIRWGKVVTPKLPNENTVNKDLQLFVRVAKGYNKIVIALLRNCNETEIVNLKLYCPNFVMPLIVFPPNQYMPVGKGFASQAVSLQPGTAGKPADGVFVFECIDKDPLANKEATH